MKQQKYFLAYLISEAEHQRQNGHFCLADNYRSSARSFGRFLQKSGRQDVSFTELTQSLITDYESWLLSGGICKNTSSFYIRALQAVYHKAVNLGLTTDRRPFISVYRGVARTMKRAISPDEVRRLSGLDIRAALRGQGFRGKGLVNRARRLEFARDIFLFCFCARGLTFVDLAYMQKTNVSRGMLVYVRRKTKQRIEVKIEPMMQDIMERYRTESPYLLPILTRTGDDAGMHRQYRYALFRYNAQLEILGDMLGGVKLTSYVSRHSWASAAYQLHVPLSVISQSMGHDSERTTEIYVKSLETNVINQANHELLCSVFQPVG